MNLEEFLKKFEIALDNLSKKFNFEFLTCAVCKQSPTENESQYTIYNGTLICEYCLEDWFKEREKYFFDFAAFTLAKRKELEENKKGNNNGH